MSEQVERRKVTVNVCTQAKWENGPLLFDGTLNEVISKLSAIRDTIPEQYRGEAVCEIGDDGDRECPKVQIEITYVRPETDAELEARVRMANADARYYAQRVEESDRREYERLKAKFG